MRRPSPSRSTWTRTPAGLVVPRRTALRSGLGVFAAALVGCSDDSSASSGSGTGTGGSGATGSTGSSGSSGSTVASSSSGGTGGGGGAGGGGGGGYEFPVRDLPELPALTSLLASIGALGDPDENGVRLPPGFTSRIVAESDVEPLAGGTHRWHFAPDGGATYPTEDGGWIYVSNSEVPALVGGAGALRFDADGALVGSTAILTNTSVNCAGGRTPWHTWLSCEEIPRGQVWECDPWGELPPVARPALGLFKHEAAAIDHDRGHVYLTEDVEDGRLYRFVPDGTIDGHPDLRSGTLEVALVDDDGAVTWEAVPDPQFTGQAATREQVPASRAFSGGEGIWYHQGSIFFACKGEGRIYALDVEASRLTVLYDAETAADPILTGVDNVTVSASGDVLVAEDGGDMQIVAILPDGGLVPVLQVTGHDNSEICGPAFDPSGTRLYFSSQRGRDGGGGGGITFEITGPFHEPA